MAIIVTLLCDPKPSGGEISRVGGSGELYDLCNPSDGDNSSIPLQSNSSNDDICRVGRAVARSAGWVASRISATLIRAATTPATCASRAGVSSATRVVASSAGWTTTSISRAAVSSTLSDAANPTTRVSRSWTRRS
ncbi:hypothetical protein SUGI_0701960 [Cryptomeria japonica]|nr:hypothetical protein SUGI_0701960 [Cryptomeria japonica]